MFNNQGLNIFIIVINNSKIFDIYSALLHSNRDKGTKYNN